MTDMAHPNLKFILIGGVVLFGLTGGVFLLFNAITERERGSFIVDVAFPLLDFERPVDIQFSSDLNLFFVAEQGGRIYSFRNSPTVSQKSLVLDIANKVSREGEEMGLLGLALHPNFSENGLMYVDYTTEDPRRTVISKFKVSISLSTAPIADPTAETVILEVEQPYSNHNGGQIAFGPDGFLYIALGDGGAAGDPQGNGQNRKTLLGSILRIDVNKKEGEREYSVPADNPFVGNGQGYREEIFAYGLRNPWRFSFDRRTGMMWAGDVGQNKWEEIDIIEKGKNYGWNIMEGNHCYNPSVNCDKRGLEPPIWEYGRDEGKSVTGGFVYRGLAFPELVGNYIFGDFISGKIWALQKLGNEYEAVLLASTDLNIATFGIDDNNEIYLAAFDGKIYQLARS